MTQEPEETQETRETQPRHPLEGVKVVVTVFGEGALIGVSRGDVDPHVETVAIDPQDGIEEVLPEVPGVLERARARWEEQPRFPDYQAPVLPPGAQGPGPGRQGGTASRRRQGNQQQQMF